LREWIGPPGDEMIEFCKKWWRLVKAFGVRWGTQIFYSIHVVDSLAPKYSIKQLDLKKFKFPIFYRARSSDASVFEQTLVLNEYEVPIEAHRLALEAYYQMLLADGKRPLVIDCGANIGLSSVWFARRFPNAAVIAVEPEPDNFAVLLKNVAGYQNIKPIQAAISDHASTVSLQNVANEPWAWETKESETGPISTVTVSQLLGEAGSSAPLLVKIDIEGFEVQLFRSNSEWTSGIPLIVFESHDWLFHWRGTAHAILSVLCKDPRDYLQKGENTFALLHSLLSGKE
jgi:FkbM family methyltransferase